MHCTGPLHLPVYIHQCVCVCVRDSPMELIKCPHASVHVSRAAPHQLPISRNSRQHTFLHTNLSMSSPHGVHACHDEVSQPTAPSLSSGPPPTPDHSTDHTHLHLISLSMMAPHTHTHTHLLQPLNTPYIHPSQLTVQNDTHSGEKRLQHKGAQCGRRVVYWPLKVRLLLHQLL